MSAVIDFLSQNGMELLGKTWEHLYISLLAAGLGVIVAVPLGVILTRFEKAAGPVMSLLGMIQTIPSFAILAFFIPLFGIGKIPAIIALFFYSVLPILRNTYTGIKGVNTSLLEAGRGMGMTGWERIRYVELPLSIPVIMAGVRVSTVYLIGWATLASYIGAGGLGDYIFSGLNLYQPEYIIAGAIPVTILALIVDLILGKVENKVTPKAIREKNKTA
ncbi:ABC transporter permease [Cytobacillus horneckiae]|uniref:ABC transporter permease n=1 Tax=Cytobacillus horneckiae TaxID=549687 RepID=A0A2N0ZC71_9BACI|nr:ABC transporter permease [Cytobacillus horneckiae]MCM3177533.1 ABC transporter permease [Cytobacillus horneckiae]MEC1155903.1 ABC transporter permease [Cytobacillus horneckiae]MED2939821.1 ABC transporter permease [Cytobacillus horneckiae]PKG27122.1 ABC transporter permease [Cytobacillus horneckiae]